MAQSSQGRLAPAGTAQADLPAFVAGEQDFAFDLYRQFSSKVGNLLFSPHSLYLNLSMDYAGARSETERQMAAVLHITLPGPRLHAAANTLDQDLSAAGSKDSTFQLSVANSLWAQQDYVFEPAFLDLLAQNYGTGMRLVDYTQSQSREQAALAISQWGSDQTHGKITALVAPQDLDAKTRLMLASTIYLHAEWLERFEPSLGRGSFTLRDGKPATVPFITSQRFDNQGRSINTSGIYPVYDYKNEFTMVEVPYKGGRGSFIALLTKESYPLEALEASLTAEKLRTLLTLPPGPYKAFIEMPKFSLETAMEFSGKLSALGMPDAFDSQKADFSGMTGSPNILISRIAQKTFMRVNELGTEAASASFTGFIEIAAPILISLNRPFLFLILDRPSGAVLFLGRIEDPR